MAFASLSCIKTHLLGSGFPPLEQRDSPCTLSGTDDFQLPHHNLLQNSVTVKWLMQALAHCDSGITLNGYDWSSLTRDLLLRQSAVVTLSDSLASIYIEERDFQLDTAAGRIRRVPGSQIPDGLTVMVFYQYYTRLSGESDYLIDTARGTIRRREGGALPDGASVSVDYTVSGADVTDELINAAISEAHDRIVRQLSAGYSTLSEDSGLRTGKTELVLAALARDRAADVLSRLLTSDAAGRAREWQSLATLYESRGWQTLRPFLDPYAQHSPERATRE